MNMAETVRWWNEPALLSAFPFGKHCCGEGLNAVPEDYLKWIVDASYEHRHDVSRGCSGSNGTPPIHGGSKCGSKWRTGFGSFLAQ